VLNGTFVKRKDPSLPVVVVRLYPLTAKEISTVAFATTPPEESFTTPSIDPEFPPCAHPDAAVNNNTNAKIE
jgi:hypothetical protein